ncbi:MAG TPA: long-chain fatty acid--CoA ligase [Solirubrobacterales bacterium]|jgi:Long-chain acyl-CoA synthetases (AMP-forming)|nr:long-chain fatty acid--CoA ligase [Solirubrobacterales bacterium]
MGRGTKSTTLADLLPCAAKLYGDAPAIRYKEDGAWVSRSFDQVLETVRSLSLGLVDLGVAKGDKVSILADTRPEWTYFDFAALSAGAVVVPIYQTNSPEECRYVLENSDAKVVVVEDDEQLEKIREVRANLPKLEHVVRMTGSSDDAISFDDLIARGNGRPAAEWEQRWSTVEPSDICTFIYTSGTTGPPKGCIISHGNYRSMLDMVNETSVIEDEDVTYLYLPLAHSFALLIQLGSFDLGATLAYWERDPLKILPNLAELKPTYFPSVPRIFEKIYTAATSGMEKEGGLKKAIFNWAIEVGQRVRETERAGREPGFLLGKKYGFADAKVLSKIRSLFGGNLRLAVSGAAPINPEILRFFDAAGVLVLEGWGMTETSTAATISSPEDFKIGTIGKPFPGCEVRIAEDGEILVKGPNVFQGYYKNEEATRETIVDGWLHTGDIGEIDSDGFIKITGRKKDIIITAGGKNITPANLEAEIKQQPLVSQCVVVGDRRPYLVALVTLDPEEMAAYAREHGLAEDPEQLAANADVHAAIMAHVEKINQNFARVEQVKKIAILPHDLSQESGELTPTLKVKRAVVASKHEPEIEKLYAG